MALATHLKKWSRWGGRAVLLVSFAAAVILLVLWLAGKFAPKVPTEPRRRGLPWFQSRRSRGVRASCVAAALRIRGRLDPRGT